MIDSSSSQALISGESLRGETRQSSNYYSTGTLYSSHRAMDGDRSTCAHTMKLLNSWWRIDLLGVYDISSITFSYSGHPHVDMTDGRIHVGNSRKNNGTANPLVKNISNENYMSLHSFDSGVSGRYITITVPGTRFLILCEVNITGTVKGNRLMMKKPTKQCWKCLFIRLPHGQPPVLLVRLPKYKYIAS
uniref:Fucolectin tachylectin-4 pentraxin-1 domain-containing protein n=1 Tax=Gouania willdenowi TaxID=441366 RepID=A0A8C5EU46_GOUWI